MQAFTPITLSSQLRTLRCSGRPFPNLHGRYQSSKIQARRKRPYLRLAVTFVVAAAAGAAIRYSISQSEPSGPSSQSLNPITFTPYTLLSKEPVSSTSAIFTLRRPVEPVKDPTLSDLRKRGIWSIQVKQPQLQIARAYTPLPPAEIHSQDEDPEANELRLLIRREEKGEVSGYLHSLPIGATIEVRGPNMELELPPNVREVIFLAGGTGIAPALQLADALRERKSVTMHVLWANKKREDCVGAKTDAKSGLTSGFLLAWKSFFGLEKTGSIAESATAEGVTNPIVRQLEDLRAEWESDGDHHLNIKYYVDEERTLIDRNTVTRLLSPEASNQPSSSDVRMILISGPEGFIHHWAGSKKWEGGREVQGPLRGLLSGMDLGGRLVWKL